MIPWIFVTLGQPALFPLLGPVAASMAFALYWKKIIFLPEKSYFKNSFFWFFLSQIVQLSWMMSFEYQGFYVIAVCLGVAAALALQFAVLSTKICRIKQLNWIDLFALSGLWVLFEFSRLYFFCGFAFNFLGMFLAGSIFSLQLASIFGVLGLSFWVVLTNLLCLKSFESPSFLWKWMIFLVVPYVYGMVWLSQEDNSKPSLNVLLVQTALSPSQKHPLPGRKKEFISPFHQWNFVLNLMSPYRGFPIDLIVLPESVLPFPFEEILYDKTSIDGMMRQVFGKEVQLKETSLHKVSHRYLIESASKIFQCPVIGGFEYEEESLFYNSMVYCDFEKNESNRYDKKVLLPFSEGLPFRNLAWMSALYGIVSFFTPGDRDPIFFSKIPLGLSICYEELFPSKVRSSVMLGAEMLVNVSSDAWYPNTILSKQHFSHGLLRSVENGIPLIRSCNQGVTAAVDCFGRVLEKTEDFNPKALFIKVPCQKVNTLFSCFGDVPLVLASSFFVVVSFSSIKCRKKKVPRSNEK